MSELTSTQARALQVISDHVHHNPSGGSWKSQPELPGKDELCQGAEPHDLPRNPVDRPWASKEAYLEAQYKILRMEGTEGLRASVGHFRADPEMADDSLSCVYREVRIPATQHLRHGQIAPCSGCADNGRASARSM